MKRRAALALLAAGAFGGARAAERLPLRNLLVEWRQGEAAQFETRRADGGALIVARDGTVSARAGVSVEARAGESSRDTVQQVRVLNGGRAAVRIGAQLPMHWIGWVATSDGPVAVLGSALVDTDRGFVVQPRWPGGAAPVTVEVLTAASALSGGAPSRYAPDGQPLPEGSVDQSGVLTTLQLPLGEWVTVASSGEARRIGERGGWSSQDAAVDRRQVVQLRVTAP